MFVTRLEGLVRKDGKLFVTRPGTDGPEAVAVTVRYLRPLTSRTEAVLVDEKGNEVATVGSLQALPAEQRELVEEALRERYHLLAIQKVLGVELLFGTRYWTVETDRGRRQFALREPGKNVTWLDERHLVLRDTAGNRYEITDVGALDAESRAWVQRSL